MKLLVVFACFHLMVYTSKSLDCGPNSHYTPCISNCPLTCDNKDLGIVCSQECRRDGCACDEGFLLDKEGNCIINYKCPPCGPNEYYELCGSGCGYPLSVCGKYIEDPEDFRICPAYCRSVCLCKSGYLRNTQQKCVKPQHCQ
ncbi:PREDICTED: cysteine-rich venom protein 6-like [Nicrophorus vespilloides]|uniref:Cysteine-rich venom protein 6-like n=1 Tax=Nicrophorus vespilloides TaxID=110193 RepID=A0ABM1NJI0_NICVS|nr:PREDICTED: cysteine-rich venom protein 6-like [Nicrophorus vespilloides]